MTKIGRFEGNLFALLRTATLLLICGLFGVEAAAQNLEASTSQAAKEAAKQSIPWGKLNQQTQQKLSNVVGRPSLYRRLPTKVIDCEPDMFVFLVRYPEVVVNIWEIMGVSNVNIRRTGDYTFTAQDNGGTTCNVELVYGSPNLHILFADASYKGNLLTGTVRGKCVLLLKSEYVQQGGRTFVNTQMDMFVKVDSLGADLIARTLQPMIGRSADINFTETADFMSRVSVASQTNQHGVLQLAQQLNGCTPPVRNKFAEVSNGIHNRYQQVLAATATTQRVNPYVAVPQVNQAQAYPTRQVQQSPGRQGPTLGNASAAAGRQPYPYQVNRPQLQYRQ